MPRTLDVCVQCPFQRSDESCTRDDVLKGDKRFFSKGEHDVYSAIRHSFCSGSPDKFTVYLKEMLEE